MNSRMRVFVAVLIVAVAMGVFALRPATDVDKGNIERAIAGKTVALPKLLDLGADRCVPCKMMAPILEELGETFAGEMQVDFLDVWKNPDAAKPYDIKIIPTQIFFAPDGTELFRHEGFFSREDILAKWQELGYKLPVKDA